MGDQLAALPGFVPAKVQGAFFLLASGRYRDARRCAIEAAAAAPRSSALNFEIVRLLRVFEATPRSMPWWPDGAGPMARRPTCSCRSPPSWLYDEAGRLLGLVAQAQAPRLPAIHTLQGTIAMVTGDMQAAATSFRHALASSTAELPHVRWLMTLAAPDAPEASVDAIREAAAAVGARAWEPPTSPSRCTTPATRTSATRRPGRRLRMDAS